MQVVFPFRATFSFSPINAVIYENIDLGIHKWIVKVAQNEKKFFVGFMILKIFETLKCLFEIQTWAQIVYLEICIVSECIIPVFSINCCNQK